MDETLLGETSSTGRSYLQKPLLIRSTIAVAVVAVIVVVIVAIVLSLPSSKKQDDPSAPVCPLLSSNASTSPIVFIVSFDGFANTYLTQYAEFIPNIMAHIKHGTRAVLRDATPTLTFPMHYTLATGLYTESHGIVGNSMFDPVFNASFSLSNGQALQGRWWGGDPIWNVIQRSGRRSGVYFWPGSEAEINGQRPTHYLPFKDNAPNIPRITQIFEWIDTDECDLCMLYFSDVDHEGHSYGTSSPQVRNALIEMDKLVAIMTSCIQERRDVRPINLIFVSDHGMVNIDKKIPLNQYINNTITPYRAVDSGALSNIMVYNSSNIPIIYNNLKSNLPNAKIYLKSEVPVEYHYSNNRRIFDIIIEADEGVYIGSNTNLHATHGYNSVLPSMQAIFLANGPAFLQGGLLDVPLNNVDIFSIIAKILNVTNLPLTNGSITTIQPYLTL